MRIAAIAYVIGLAVLLVAFRYELTAIRQHYIAICNLPTGD